MVWWYHTTIKLENPLDASTTNHHGATIDTQKGRFALEQNEVQRCLQREPGFLVCGCLWSRRIDHINISSAFDLFPFSLIQIKQKEKEMRLLILGLDNAGKTTVVKKLMGASIDTIEPTLGFSIQTLQHATGYTLHVWDVGGQKSLRAYWRNYFEATDGLIFVVDSTDSRRLQDCRESLCSLLAEERLAGATLLILCNKQDQTGALSEEELARLLNLDALLTKFSSHPRHYKILSCSAVTGQGLSEGLDWLVQDIASRIYLLT